ARLLEGIAFRSDESLGRAAALEPLSVSTRALSVPLPLLSSRRRLRRRRRSRRGLRGALLIATRQRGSRRERDEKHRDDHPEPRVFSHKARPPLVPARRRRSPLSSKAGAMDKAPFRDYT